MKYSEKLNNPRWQRKRLEIFNRDDWTCQKCKREDRQLNVHHKKYIKGLEPWEHPDDTMVTYCYKCHKAKHATAVKVDKEYQDKVRKRVYNELKDELNLPPYEQLVKNFKT